MADTWTPISRYTPQDYTDTLVFEMSAETKKLEKIVGQALVAGEENSQYIKFVLPRYWDGIDISGKSFGIEYALAGTYYGTSEAVNAEMSTDQVRFGWVVPKNACAISGTLFFVLKVDSTDYVLKSQIADTPVFKTIDAGDVVPEPTKEQWWKCRSSTPCNISLPVSRSCHQQNPTHSGSMTTNGSHSLRAIPSLRSIQHSTAYHQ